MGDFKLVRQCDQCGTIVIEMTPEGLLLRQVHHGEKPAHETRISFAEVLDKREKLSKDKVEK